LNIEPFDQAMQIHQILIRPREQTVIVLFEDIVGRKESLSFNSTGDSRVAAVVAECQQKLPPDSEHPAKKEIQAEISELENRVQKLRTSIGQA
jgi:hypothetical protein